MQENQSVLRICIPSPLRRLFDYLPASDIEFEQLQPGMRLQVPFGHRKTVGLLVDKANSSDFSADKLKQTSSLLDDTALLSPEILELLKWVARYYHHPPGEVYFSALPTLLRKGNPLPDNSCERWRLSEAGRSLDIATLGKAKRQLALLEFLKRLDDGADAQLMNQQLPNWRPVMKKLIEKQLVDVVDVPAVAREVSSPVNQHVVDAQGTEVCKADDLPLELSTAQHQAVQQITDKLDQFQAFLLEGVTGSGKTEVYLRVIEAVVKQGRQALVLVPEIGLTPQMVARFRRRFHCPVAVFHSGLNDKERLSAWLSVRDGSAPVIIGTRSAVFTPTARLGVIIIDEEHDLSFKQQEGFRYSARDVAVKRAHQNAIPIVLGSATPSLECLHNVQTQRYKLLGLPERVGGAQHPGIRLLDVRAVKMKDGLSPALLATMQQHLDKGNQVLLFLNRRGYAPALLCHDCGWVSHCERCDANMTIHQRDQRQRCHHCGADKPLVDACPQCRSQELQTYGAGTERVEQALKLSFPDKKIIRMDRDTTRRKGSFEALLDQVNSGEGQILIGTQLLAKGHHFPNVTLVGVLNADNELFSSDFRASERMSQLLVQVAGRAGRAEKPGEVLIQTHQPDHPLLLTMIRHGYQQFAKMALEERRLADLPPYTHLALLRAEAVDSQSPETFLQAARNMVAEYTHEQVIMLGPLPAPMEKRAGRYRAQLLLQSASRSALHQLLDHWTPRLETLKQARKVRWSLDVDPMEMI